ncbi:hypothetical protein RHSIM_Rhsim12G0200900 [Rhododendron simsii]|uniref:Uncharacterized protein n=1 Tax=Rhododendron simsii TaxID=118357 RepID=A0A834L8F8_RHOSS|nr:hypothetical protein RHSIM_Rhsim12G0200900 [Rhododendron simsii]
MGGRREIAQKLREEERKVGVEAGDGMTTRDGVVVLPSLEMRGTCIRSHFGDTKI